MGAGFFPTNLWERALPTTAVRTPQLSLEKGCRRVDVERRHKLQAKDELLIGEIDRELERGREREK